MKTRSVLASTSDVSSETSSKKFIGRRTGKVFVINSYDELFSDSETDASLDITRNPSIKEEEELSPEPNNKVVLGSKKDGSFSRPLSAKQIKRVPAAKKNAFTRVGRRTGKDIFAGKKKLQETGRVENFSDLFSDTDDSMSLHPTPERTLSSASLASNEDSDVTSKRSERSIRRRKISYDKSSQSKPVLSLVESVDVTIADGTSSSSPLSEPNRNQSVLMNSSTKRKSISSPQIILGGKDSSRLSPNKSRQESCENNLAVDNLIRNELPTSSVAVVGVESQHSSSVLDSNKLLTKQSKSDLVVAKGGDMLNTSVSSSLRSSGVNGVEGNSSIINSSPSSKNPNLSSCDNEADLHGDKQYEMGSPRGKSLRNSVLGQRGIVPLSPIVIVRESCNDNNDDHHHLHHQQPLKEGKEISGESSQHNSSRHDSSDSGKENNEPGFETDVSDNHTKTEKEFVLHSSTTAAGNDHDLNTPAINRSSGQNEKEASLNQSQLSNSHSPRRQSSSASGNKATEFKGDEHDSSIVCNKDEETPSEPAGNSSTHRQAGLDFGGTAVGSVSNADKVLPSQFFGIKKRLTFCQGIDKTRQSTELESNETSFKQGKSYPGSFLDHHSKDKTEALPAVDNETDPDRESSDGFMIVDRDEINSSRKQNSNVTLTGRKRSSLEDGNKSKSFSGGHEKIGITKTHGEMKQNSNVTLTGRKRSSLEDGNKSKSFSGGHEKSGITKAHGESVNLNKDVETANDEVMTMGGDRSLTKNHRKGKALSSRTKSKEIAISGDEEENGGISVEKDAAVVSRYLKTLSPYVSLVQEDFGSANSSCSSISIKCLKPQTKASKSQNNLEKSVVKEVQKTVDGKANLEADNHLESSNVEGKKMKSFTRIKREKGILQRNAAEGRRTRRDLSNVSNLSHAEDMVNAGSFQEGLNESFGDQQSPSSSSPQSSNDVPSKGKKSNKQDTEVIAKKHSPLSSRKRKINSRQQKSTVVVKSNDDEDVDEYVPTNDEGNEVVNRVEVVEPDPAEQILEDKANESDASSPLKKDFGKSKRKMKQKRGVGGDKKKGKGIQQRGETGEEEEKEDEGSKQVETPSPIKKSHKNNVRNEHAESGSSSSSPLSTNRRVKQTRKGVLHVKTKGRSHGNVGRKLSRKASQENKEEVRLQPMSMFPRVTPTSGVSFRRKSSFIPSRHVSIDHSPPGMDHSPPDMDQSPPGQEEEEANTSETPKRISNRSAKSSNPRKRALTSILNDLPGSKEPEPDPIGVANAKVQTPTSKKNVSLRKRAIMESARTKGLRLIATSPVVFLSPRVEINPFPLNLSPSSDSTILPSPSSTPVHYAETTMSNRRESDADCLIFPDLSYKIIRPEDSNSGLRRSKRTRVQRIHHYKGEGIVYRRDSQGFRVVDSIMPSLGEAKVLAMERKRSKKRLKRKFKSNAVPAKTRRMSTHLKVENVTNDSEISVINPDTEERVVVELVAHDRNASWIGPSLSTLTPRDTYGISVLLNQPSFCSGQLHIRPLCEKPKQMAVETLVFFLISGKVCVTVNNSSFVVENRDDFFVPRGSHYNIKNLRSDIAQLKFLNFHDEISSKSATNTPLQLMDSAKKFLGAKVN